MTTRGGTKADLLKTIRYLQEKHAELAQPHFYYYGLREKKSRKVVMRRKGIGPVLFATWADASTARLVHDLMPDALEIVAMKVWAQEVKQTREGY